MSAASYLAVAGLAFALAGCASGPSVATPTAAAAPETITVAVGPCFGFCPVYRAAITPGGVVTFEGERHTAVLGERHREGGAAAYRTLVADLAVYRPASGVTAQVPCAAAITDTSSYTLTWRGPDGRETVVTLQSGCAEGPARALGLLLRALPERLGIADWARQTTRPGASRG